MIATCRLVGESSEGPPGPEMWRSAYIHRETVPWLSCAATALVLRAQEQSITCWLLLRQLKCEVLEWNLRCRMFIWRSMFMEGMCGRKD